MSNFFCFALQTFFCTYVGVYTWLGEYVPARLDGKGGTGGGCLIAQDFPSNLRRLFFSHTHTFAKKKDGTYVLHSCKIAPLSPPSAAATAAAAAAREFFRRPSSLLLAPRLSSPDWGKKKQGGEGGAEQKGSKKVFFAAVCESPRPRDRPTEAAVFANGGAAAPHSRKRRGERGKVELWRSGRLFFSRSSGVRRTERGGEGGKAVRSF